jgi:hypothetical protein
MVTGPNSRETTARYVVEVEPLIRGTATLELDGLMPVQLLADHVEQCLICS